MAVRKHLTSYEVKHKIYIGKKLKSRRLKLGLTQTKVAKLVGVTFQQVQK